MFDASGTGIPHEGAVTWSASDTNATTADTGTSATFTLAANQGGASSTINAAIDGVDCMPAQLDTFATAQADRIRVLVVSSVNNTPVPDATVVLDTQTATTGPDGIALFDTTGEDKHTVSVFAEHFAYVTVLDTTATDIFIPVKPAPPHPGKFTGQLKDTDFSGLSNPNGTMHLFICGSSIAGNLFDLSLSTLLGPPQPVAINLGTGTAYGPFGLPSCIVIGLGSQVFGDNGGGHYEIDATPGKRAFWAIGGNAVIGDVLKAIGPVLNGGGGDIQDQIPTILTALLPIIGNLESGVTAGVDVAPDQMGSVNSNGGPSLQVDTLERLHLDVVTPQLITYTDSAGQPAAFDGAVVIGGALVPSQGFVPLGLTAGVDQAGPPGGTVPDHITDAVGFTGQAGHLPLRLAPKHGGIEQAPWSFITLGAPLSKLIGGGDGLVLSGTVTFAPTVIKYNSGASMPADLSHPFLPVANGVALDEATRTLTAPPVEGATFHQLDVGSEDALWSIYFPAGTTSVTVPAPPAGFADRFTGSTLPSALLKSISLGYGSTTYDAVWQFDDVNANDLTRQTDSFSVRALSRVVTPTP